MSHFDNLFQDSFFGVLTQHMFFFPTFLLLLVRTAPPSQCKDVCFKITLLKLK